MANGIDKLKIFDFARSKNDSFELVYPDLYYVIEEPTELLNGYFITTNKEAVKGLVELAGNELLEIEELFNVYASLQLELAYTDGYSIAFKIINKLGGFKVTLTVLPLKLDKCRKIIPALRVFKEYEKLESKLNHKGVLITIKNAKGTRVVRSSLKWETLYEWLETDDLSEVLKVVGHFNRGYDMGKVLIPNLDKVGQSFEYISLLDITAITILEE